MNHALENYNIARDPRSQGPAEAPEVHFYGCGTCGSIDCKCDCPDNGCDISEPLPMKWGVCPVCDGKGSHVNPSIDASGISREQFEDDPDFAEQYWNGTFDQTCTRCNGRTTVPIVDADACEPKLLQLYREQLQDEADDRACQLAEIRAGA